MTDMLDHEVMTGLELMDATRTVVRTLGRDKELDVEFAGEEACTNGKRVQLPSVPNETPVTKRQAMVVGGFANHETLHKLLTDFKGAGERMQQLVDEGRRSTAALANAIEDVRIENGGKVMYPGMPDAINQTARHVTRKFIDEIYPQDPTVVDDFQKIGPVAVTWAGRKMLGYDDESYDEALQLLPDDVRERVEHIANAAVGLEHGVRRMGADSINRTKALAGSRESVELAEMAMKEYLKQKEEEEEERGKGKSNEEGEDGDQGEDEGTSQNQGDDEQADGEEASSDAGGKGDAEDGEEEQDATRAGHGAVKVAPESEPVGAELDSALAEMIGEINDKRGNDDFRMFAPGLDRIAYDDFVDPMHNDHFRRLYTEKLSKLGAVVGTVRRKLERALIAEDYVGWQSNVRRGRLDVGRNASKIVQFKPNVYRQREVDESINTAVLLLVDLSYSMAGSKARHACNSIIALAEALEPTKVSYEIMGHKTEMSKRGYELVEEYTEKSSVSWHNSPFDRIEQVDMPVFKKFDETLRNARHKIGALENQVDNANADACAIRYATQRLSARREERKVLMVLSDGAPAWNLGNSNRTMEEWTIEQIRRTEQSGIEVIGVGIIDKTVKDLYSKHVVINSADDLATGVMDQLSSILTGRSLRVSA